VGAICAARVCVVCSKVVLLLCVSVSCVILRCNKLHSALCAVRVCVRCALYAIYCPG
jgi:hypothetical protein